VVRKPSACRRMIWPSDVRRRRFVEDPCDDTGAASAYDGNDAPVVVAPAPDAIDAAAACCCYCCCWGCCYCCCCYCCCCWITLAPPLKVKLNGASWIMSWTM
jgi:hypothetical protein